VGRRLLLTRQNHLCRYRHVVDNIGGLLLISWVVLDNSHHSLPQLRLVRGKGREARLKLADDYYILNRIGSHPFLKPKDLISELWRNTFSGPNQICKVLCQELEIKQDMQGSKSQNGLEFQNNHGTTGSELNTFSLPRQRRHASGFLID
jgi:hypothetical protein